MSAETDEVGAADTELAHAMSRLIRAIDAVGDDGQAAQHISQEMPETLRRLATRLDAALGF
jgi:ABC-type transporter Mla subunit MlaD